MDPRRILPVVVLGEGAILACALVYAWWAGVPLAMGDPVEGAALGTAGALALAVVNLGLLRWQRNGWPGASLRHVCRIVVRPLFEHANAWHIVLVSALAGVAEELLFRGVLQPAVGLTAASLVFGAVHVGGRGFVGYGAWAACIGAMFGWLMVASGGLLAPTVAHAAYDALALAFVRYRLNDICD